MLIAEDEAIIRLDLREMLEEEGAEVVGEAADGETAARLARELRPDVVLVDVKMPDRDGLSVAQELSSERIAPCVVVTAFSQREVVARATEAGAMAYVVKPFHKPELMAAIEIARARWEEQRSLEQEARDLKEALEARKLVERAKGALMRAHGLGEAEAFRLLQKASMDSRRPLKEVAEAVLKQLGA